MGRKNFSLEQRLGLLEQLCQRRLKYQLEEMTEWVGRVESYWVQQQFLLPTLPIMKHYYVFSHLILKITP